MSSSSSSTSSCSSFHITIVLFFVALSTLSHDVIAGLGYTQRSCNEATGGTYLPNSTYSSNLNQLLTSFVSYANSTNTALFHNATFPNSHPTSSATATVYGLYLCRGDDDPSACSACISSAATDIRNMCPNSTEAIIWKELCMLRYSNRSTIFSTLDTSFSYNDGQMMYNVNNITDFDSWMKVRQPTIKDVTARAAAGGGPGKKKFATEEANYQNIYTLYTLAECTPDLTSDDCRTCFTAAIGFSPSRSQGGIVMLPSCNLRFEIYPFYQNFNVPPTTLQGPQPSDSSLEARRHGKNKKHVGLIVGIVVAVCVLLPCLFCIFYFCIC